MQTVIIMKGLPASGKSTFAKNLIQKEPGKYKRINKDDLREMLDSAQFSDKNEKFILNLRDHLIVEALESGYSVIVDDTNLAPKHEARIRDLVGDKATVTVHSFDISPEECIKRDAQRARSVGPSVIWQMYYQFLYKAPETPQKRPDFPFAIVCDIDGTLAHMKDRGPFDWKRVGEDEVDESVAIVLSSLAHMGHIVLLSGRDSVCRKETEEWLKAHNVAYDHLIMRAEGDNRADEIIKKEIFDKQVYPHWDVLFVIDDRPKVCRMWRSLGLKVFQVGDPHREF